MIFRRKSTVALAMILTFCVLRTRDLKGDDAAGNVSRADATSSMFNPARLLDVVVKMDAADWQKMRYEHHNLFFPDDNESESSSRKSPYSYYRASVTIDGKTIHNVGVRKKGFLGSVNAQRPSIKINFDKFVSKQRFNGLEMMTLNNNDTDPFQASQYLSYFIFRKAGLPAPRCSFARVTVNGEYLGVFSHVESVRKRFLKRNFGTASGNLYEGQISDFLSESVKTFQKKTNKKVNDRADLDKVVAALQADDSVLVKSLQDVLDLDQFYRYWATEVLVGFWDSYSGNRNNFFVYRVPSDNKFRFIPWGTDGAMRWGSGKASEVGMPISVQAKSIIPYRLYSHAETRERYRKELRKLLNEVWDEKELLSELDRIEAMIAPHMHTSAEMLKQATGRLRTFISRRRQALMSELTSEAPQWPGPRPEHQQRASDKDRVFPSLRGDFKAVWAEHTDFKDDFAASDFGIEMISGDGSAALKTKLFYDERKIVATKVVIARNTSSTRFDFPLLFIIWKHEGRPETFALRLLIDPGFYKAGKEIPVDGYTVFPFLLRRTSDTGWSRIAWVRGKLKFSKTGTRVGEPVIGELDLELLTNPRSDAELIARVRALPRALELFRELDSDRNGVLDLTELGKAKQPLVKGDTDGDKNMSLRELIQFLIRDDSASEK